MGNGATHGFAGCMTIVGIDPDPYDDEPGVPESCAVYRVTPNSTVARTSAF